MDFLIALDNGAVLVNLNDSILHLARIYPGFVNLNVDWELLPAGFLLQAQHKGALVDGPNKSCALLTRGRYVVARFR